MCMALFSFFFFFNDTATTEIYTLSLHDALPILSAGGDPVLAFAPDGTLYYSALVYDFSYPNRTPSGVAVAASHDGGATWGAPVMVHYEAANNFFNDKEWIAAGAGGNVYVTWTLFNPGP